MPGFDGMRGVTWTFPQAHRAVDKLVHGPATPENSGFLPDAVAIAHDRALADLIEAWTKTLNRKMAVIDSRVSFLSIGVALLDIVLEWPENLPTEPVQAQVDFDVEVLMRSLGPRVDELVTCFHEATADLHPIDPSAEGSQPVAWSSVRDARSQILWVHRTYVQYGGSSVAMRPPNVHRVVEFSDLEFTPGIDWSVVHVHEYREDPDWILRVSRSCQAYLAIIEDMDKSVYLLLARATSSYEGIATHEISVANHDLLEYMRSARLLQARLESSIVALGGASIAVWRSVAEVQSWYHIQENISRNLSALRDLIESRRAELDSQRAHALNIIAMILTLAGVLATVVAVISFIFGGELSSFDLLRLCVIALLLFGSGMFVYRLVKVRLL